MEHRNRDQNGKEGLLYRLEVQGAVRPDWSRWFGADTVTPAGPNTVIRVRVVDQSDLYGRLRRIHDLNLQLVSVQRMDEGRGASESHSRSAEEEGRHLVRNDQISGDGSNTVSEPEQRERNTI